MEIRGPASGLLLLALVGAVGCTEVDEAIVEVGVARLNVVGPVMTPQAPVGEVPPRFDEPGIQSASWTFNTADLRAAKDTFDLLVGDACGIEQSFLFGTNFSGKCRAGIVIGAADGRVSSTLTLDADVSFNRVEPLILEEMDDEDGDGVANVDDNCPLVDNPGQEEGDLAGVGEACTVNFLGLILADSDDDGVPDEIDNCVYVANPGQEDGTDPRDAIGDACEGRRQTASASVDLVVDLGDVRYREGRTYFVTADFVTADSLQCDFVAGTCTVDPMTVIGCVVDDLFTALAGCGP